MKNHQKPQFRVTYFLEIRFCKTVIFGQKVEFWNSVQCSAPGKNLEKWSLSSNNLLTSSTTYLVLRFMDHLTTN